MQYSEATDVFEIMDNISMWQKGSRQSYLKHWKTLGDTQSKDHKLISEYVALRKKYTKKQRISQTVIFSSAEYYPSFFEQAFYSSKSIQQAFLKLKKNKRFKNKDLNFLKKFYQHFKPRISLMVKESALFRSQLKKISKIFKKKRAVKTLGHAASFFGHKKKKKKLKLLFVWWPKKQDPIVDIKGDYLILRFNPLTALQDISIEDIMVIAVEGFMRSQSLNQKENLSKIFKETCHPGSSVITQNILELPLAVVLGKILFKKNAQKKKFKTYQKWFDDTWVNTYAQILFPLVESTIKNKETVSGEFIHSAAKLCRNLVEVGTFLSKRP